MSGSPRTLIRQLFRRVQLMVGRAVLAAIDDDRQMQAVQVEALSGEVVDRAERFQQYGLSSHPHPGAEALLLAVGGIRQHPIVAAVDDRRYRPTGLAEGEVVVYSSRDLTAPHRIHFLENGNIRLEAGRTTLELEDAGMTLTTPSGTQTWGTA